MVVLALAAYKMYTKPHRSVEAENAIVITATDLFDAFEKDEPLANKIYLNKVLEVTGRVSEVSENLDEKKIIVLETSHMIFGVRCTMADSAVSLPVGAQATIKGICTGYLSDVIITDGILKKGYEN